MKARSRQTRPCSATAATLSPYQMERGADISNDVTLANTSRDLLLSRRSTPSRKDTAPVLVHGITYVAPRSTP